MTTQAKPEQSNLPDNLEQLIEQRVESLVDGRITFGGATSGFSAPTNPASNASGALIADLPGHFLLLIQSGGSFVRRAPAR